MLPSSSRRLFAFSSRRLFAFVACAATAWIATACGAPRPVSHDPGAPRQAGRERAEVLEVIDGDTIRLDLEGSRQNVRLIGVNTPETKHPTKGVECFGPEASAFLEHLLRPGTVVRVERDLEARDAYRRLLLYVFLDTPSGERFVNLELVARGFATPLSIEPNTHYREFFVDAAFDAQQHSRGMWSRCPQDAASNTPK